MAIAFANSGSGGLTTSGTSDTVDITAAAVGDWVYCGIFNAANEASITFTGWTQLLSADQGTTSHYSLWRRQKQSGDTTFAVSWPTSQKETWIWVSYSGLDGTTPDELAAAAVASSATQTTPSLTPNSNDRWSLCFFYVRSTTSAPLAFGSYTSPLGARVDALPQAASRWVRAAAADTAGAVTQAAHQYSATSTNGSQGGAILLFLIPASGGATVNADAAVTAAGTVAADGQLTQVATGTIPATGTIAAAGQLTQVAAGTVAATGTVAAAGTVIGTVPADAALGATATITAAATVVQAAAATLTATATIAGTATQIHVAAAQVAAAGTVTGSGALVLPAAGSIAAAGPIGAAGVVVAPLPAVGTWEVAGGTSGPRDAAGATLNAHDVIGHSSGAHEGAGAAGAAHDAAGMLVGTREGA